MATPGHTTPSVLPKVFDMINASACKHKTLAASGKAKGKRQEAKGKGQTLSTTTGGTSFVLLLLFAFRLLPFAFMCPYHPALFVKPMQAHPTAVVSPLASIARDVRVGPYAVIEDEVIIKAGCEIGAHAVVKRFTSLGRRNRVYEHATLGGEPQDTKFKGERSALIIGDDNLIREYATLHRASGEGGVTRIGSRNFLMVGGKSKIVQDVLPFFTTDGNPPHVHGLNSIGLRRGGFSAEARGAIKRAYQLLFRTRLPLERALAALDEMGDENVSHLARFIRDSRRGFTREERAQTGTAERDILFKVSG